MEISRPAFGGPPVSLLKWLVLFLFVAGCGGGNPSHDSNLDLSIVPGNCSDGIKNGTESDVDCGGDCPLACGDGRACATRNDCQSLMCVGLTCAPGPSMCTDMKKDGQETDIDCGGTQCPRCADGQICLLGGDCNNGACVNGLCIPMPSTCTDVKQNGMETDIDCGGPVCPKCESGKKCKMPVDCEGALCENLICTAATCMDGIKNAKETDIDCGGPTCPRCPEGKQCMVSGDCQLVHCLRGVCGPLPPECKNGKRDGMETDVDCGGAMCDPCATGKLCGLPADCLSGRCANFVCTVPDTCSDNLLDGAETDLDCGGGICPACALGKKCVADRDCVSGACVNKACVMSPSNCMDGIKNGSETDIDCGGPMCSKCPNGKMCLAASDCTGDACNQHLCENAPSCKNGIKDGNETDVDCGGFVCMACGSGKMCLAGTDCQSGNCNLNMCSAAANCMDKIKNGMETDVDCGGPMCQKCPTGKTCLGGGDCQTNTCTNQVCTAPASCTNMMKDGLETDVDCGGGACPKCASGKLCKLASDCLSNMCSNNVCLAPGPSCNDGIQNGAESDIDCGGLMCPKCAVGKMCFGNADCQSNTCTKGICPP